MASSSEAVAKAATPARGVSTAAARVQILAGVLEKGGSGAATLLRRWAREGRPYRGHVFRPEEVEEAVAATATKEAVPSQPPAAPASVEAAQVGGKKQRDEAVADGPDSKRPCHEPGSSSVDDGEAKSEERTVSVQAKGWPTQEILAGAVAVASSLGPVRTEHGKAFSPAALLRGLYEPRVRGAGHAKHADVKVSTSNSAVQVGAHRAVLSAVSEVLSCKFNGTFADSGDSCVDATAFCPEAVRAAVEFAYLGRCEIPLTFLGALVGLADFWQFHQLADAVERCWMSLPIVCGLEVLAGLDEDSTVPAAMVGALVRSLAANFLRMEELLSRRQGADSQQIATCWRFVHELHDWLVQVDQDSVDRLRKWVSLESDEIHPAAEKFMLAAIQAASQTADAPEMKRLCKRRFKAWLPEVIISRIVSTLAKEVKFCDAAGQVQPWLHWASSGGPSLRVLVDVYSQLRRLYQEGQDQLSADVAAGLAAAPEAPGAKLVPEAIEKGFAVAFVEEAYHDPESGSFWEILLRRGTEEQLPAVEQALQLLSRNVLRSRSLPPRLATGVTLRVLRGALSVAPARAVRVLGPEALAGVYEQKHPDRSDTFVRCEGGSSLVLRRVARSREREAINIVWKGLPVEDCRKARAEWKIQKPSDDDLDVPMAVALSASEDPCNIGVRWWLRGTAGRFREDRSIQISMDALREAEADACKTALMVWARSGGSLDELEEEAIRECTDEVALPRLCKVAAAGLAEEASAAAAAAAAAAASSKAEGVAAESAAEEEGPPREEDDAEWQQAAKIFDNAVEELIRLLQEARSASTADEKRRLLAKKRRLESEPDFGAAVQRLEEPRPAAGDAA